MTDELRPRRSCLTVPGSSERFIAKARGLAADEVILDLEDAVAPAAKEQARKLIADALQAEGWSAPLRAVRINGVGTRWAYRDVIDVVERSGPSLDGEMIDEASRKLALVAAARGRAAGLRRTSQFDHPG